MLSTATIDRLWNVLNNNDKKKRLFILITAKTTKFKSVQSFYLHLQPNMIILKGNLEKIKWSQDEEMICLF